MSGFTLRAPASRSAARTLWGLLASALLALAPASPALATPTALRVPALCRPNPAGEAMIRQYVDAYNRQDVAAAYAVTAPGFARYSSTTLRRMDRETWRRMFADFVVAFPDERWEVRSMRSCGDVVTLDLVELGTFLAPWRFPDGTVVQPTRRAYRARGAIAFRLDRQTNRIRNYLYLTDPAFLSIGLDAAALQAIIRAGY